MEQIHDRRYPGENENYRAARNALLEAEIDLRRRVEAVAAMRRALPKGGKIPQDYVFEEGPADLSAGDSVSEVRMSELFAGGMNSLFVYSFMYGPDAATPCPMCVAFLDGLNGNAQHIGQRINLAVVAKAPVAKIRQCARERGWNNLRLLSSGKNSYNLDYFSEGADGRQDPPCNVFVKDSDGVFHSYGTELFFAPSEPGQHPRHVDMLWPLWNLFDMTPEGRGENWFPGTSYA